MFQPRVNDGRPRPDSLQLRRWSSVGGLFLTLLLAGAMATARAENADESPGEAVWSRWYLPASDGLLGLRYGMDRGTASELMRSRGYQARTASSEEQLRFAGKVLGEEANVFLSFLRAGVDGGGERLARIEVHWRYDGSLRVPRRIFDGLSELLTRRYGIPVRSVDDGWPAVGTGDGRIGRAHVGPETRAILEIRGVRKDVYRVELRLEFPPWAARL